jgi:hypothetical protein
VSDEDRNAMKGIGVLTALVAVMTFLVVAVLMVVAQWALDPHVGQALTGTSRALAVVGAVFALGSIAAFAAARRK